MGKRKLSPLNTGNFDPEGKIAKKYKDAVAVLDDQKIFMDFVRNVYTMLDSASSAIENMKPDSRNKSAARAFIEQHNKYRTSIGLGPLSIAENLGSIDARYTIMAEKAYKTAIKNPTQYNLDNAMSRIGVAKSEITKLYEGIVPSILIGDLRKFPTQK